MSTNRHHSHLLVPNIAPIWRSHVGPTNIADASNTLTWGCKGRGLLWAHLAQGAEPSWYRGLEGVETDAGRAREAKEADGHEPGEGQR